MQRRSRLAALATIVLVTGALAALTFASWSTQADAGPLTISAATLSPPTGLTTVSDCARKTHNWVVLSWTATASTFASGYQLFRALGSGSPVLIASLSGLSTVSYTDNGVSASRTYSYTLQASYLGWRSASSNAATITTPKNNCR